MSSRLKVTAMGGGLLSLIGAGSLALPERALAQTYTPLYEFGSHANDPNTPQGHFAQARDGNLYNTSSAGGTLGYGTVFRLTPAGRMSVLWNFTGRNSEGGQPTSGLTLGKDGDLYGATIGDGTNDDGTIFKITTAGVLTVLYNFTGKADGVGPTTSPIQGTDGNFYGSSSDDIFNRGVIYKMTPAGALTPLYSFTGSPNGNYEYPQALIEGKDGNFYGTTRGTSYGLVFKITPQGKLTVLHEFTGSPSDGEQPSGALVEDADGNFYGTTYKGGSGGYGTVYRITPAGAVNILHNFSEDTNGFLPVSGVTLGTDGNFYGSTSRGGTPSGGGAGFGVLYQLKPDGTYTILYKNFVHAVGMSPDDPLAQHTNGMFYGDTLNGGTGTTCLYCGTLFELNANLGSFVTFVGSQSAGKVGGTVGILGQGFTGTTNVSFDGTSAAFKVVSNTFLTATVPTGARSGEVTVSTPGGALHSNANFAVKPQLTSFTPSSGASGTTVTISGVSLSQTTRVTFGAKSASLTVDSDSQVTATVPSGARTGKIAISTSGGNASSTTAFTVTD